MSITRIHSVNPYSLQALPPAGQEEREIDAISNSSEVREYLEQIRANAVSIQPFAILDNGDQEYIITTDTNFIIRVHVTYTHDSADPRDPEFSIGPVNFKLDVFPPEIPQDYATGLVIPKDFDRN